MDRPKKRYHLSQARRLRDQPCPDCGHQGRVVYSENIGFTDELNPEVPVRWDCTNNACPGDGYFWIDNE